MRSMISVNEYSYFYGFTGFFGKASLGLAESA